MDDEEELDRVANALLAKQQEDQECMEARRHIQELEKERDDNCFCLAFTDQECEWELRVKQAKMAAKHRWGPLWHFRGTEQYIIAMRNKLDISKPDHREAWIWTGHLVVEYLDTRQKMDLANALAEQAVQDLSQDSDDDNDATGRARTSDTTTTQRRSPTLQ